MKIIFKHLRFKNILRYGNKWVEIDIKNGMDLIVGKNGLGKTTFADALCYNLFGKPFRKVKLASLINDKNNKNLCTELLFDIGENQFKVIRNQKPNKFEIYKFDKEWILIDQHANSKEYQAYLEDNILNINENVFRQLIALGANLTNAKHFMDLTAKEKEEILQTLLNTSIFGVLELIIKEKKNILKTNIKEYEYKLDVQKANIESTESHIRNIELENEKFLSTKNDTIKSIEETIDSYKKEAMQLKEAINQLKSVQEEQKDINSKLEPYRLKMTQLQQANEHNETQIRVLNSQKEIKCPNCGEIFKQTKINEAEVLEKREKIKKAFKKIEEIISPLDEKIKNLNAKLAKKSQYEYNLNILLKNIVNKTEELKKVKEWKIIEIDYDSLNQLKKDYEKTSEKLIEYKKDLKDYEDINTLISRKNIRGDVLHKQLPILNKCINEYLENYEVKYNFIFNKDLKETIISRDSEKEYNALSNGQKQRIVLSILFSFLKLIELHGISTNILILDEFLDSSLDDGGIEQTLEIIKNEFAKSKDVFIISHNYNIKNKMYDLNRSFEVKDENGFSKWEEN